MHTGLIIIATHKYKRFLQPLITSADRFFIPEGRVTYFIYTDEVVPLHSRREIMYIRTKHRPWPEMTLGRYTLFCDHESVLSQMGHLYYCDADMIFVDRVGEEILGDLVATQHPWYCGQRGTPETDPASLACIRDDEQMEYFCGAFLGGSTSSFLKMSRLLSDNIKADRKRGIIALWHDESHMNRYMIDHPPSLILSPAYCYHHNDAIRHLRPKLKVVDKDCAEIRN